MCTIVYSYFINNMFFGISQVPTRASPVQLLHLATGEKSDINYNVETIKNLFLDPKLQDRNVVVFSIIGAFRKGKSFLMNYVLRYMYANVSNNNKSLTSEHKIYFKIFSCNKLFHKNCLKVLNSSVFILFSNVFLFLYDSPYEKII